MTKNKLVMALGVVSILGFMATAMDAFTQWDIAPWVKPLTFIIFGGAFFLIAGGTAIFKVMEDGKLDSLEIMRILTALVGLFSVIVGLPLLPIPALQGFETEALAGVRGLVSIFAIIFIAIETFIARIIEE